ncbi:MAG: NfeD family protein [Aestuariivirga sp.]|nr:NfeD family protein [Aestuariivirga sp.]
MQELFPVAGIWFWWIVAGVLLLLELMTPGVFAMWLALAAASVGITDYFFDLNWQLELLAFAGFSLVYVYLARPWYSKNKLQNSDQPNLNQRIYAFVGKSFVLSEPIVNGEGKLDIEGTRWDVLGPNLAKGATVKVTAVEGMKLRVTEA